MAQQEEDFIKDTFMASERFHGSASPQSTCSVTHTYTVNVTFILKANFKIKAISCHACLFPVVDFKHPCELKAPHNVEAPPTRSSVCEGQPIRTELA